MFPKVDALPGPQRQATTGHRHRKTDGRQRSTHVSRHIILTFSGVNKQPVTVRYQSTKEALQVSADIRIGVFLDQKRGGGMPDMEGQQARLESFLPYPATHFVSDLE
jgi:hypothetical protein